MPFFCIIIYLKFADTRERKILVTSHLNRKKLQLNAEKAKMLIFWESWWKKKKNDWEWKGHVIETVTKFVYLQVTEEREHDEPCERKSEKGKCSGKTSLGHRRRKFKDDFIRGIMMFDSLVKGVMFCRAKLFG